jgi:hypothetical protein
MEAIAQDAPRLTVLADRLDCLTEDDIQLLTGVTAMTAEMWRKRGDGPAYIRAGKRFLYPRAGVAEWLAARVHVRKPADGKGLL